MVSVNETGSPGRERRTASASARFFMAFSMRKVT